MQKIRNFLQRSVLLFTATTVLATLCMASVVAKTNPALAASCISGSSPWVYLSGPQYAMASHMYLPSNFSYLSYLSQVGGISLDQAATFMQDMSDISGAYFDQTTNRIVFVGKKNTTQTTVFSKDDFAVAVRSLIFNNTLPSVSLGNTWTYGQPTMDVTFNGQLENTSFGSTLLDADYKLKQYFLGYTPSQSQVTSSVPSYQSAIKRYMDTPGWYNGAGSSIFRITPQTMQLKRDTSTNSFVFDQATMQVVQEPLSTSNSTAWNQAVASWAQDMTTNYDAYAQELPTWKKTKELGKLVSVVKWLKDNNIATDYRWAKDYTPEIVPTATTVPTISTPNLPKDGYIAHFEGGINYLTANNYVNDNGTAAALKSTSQSAATSAEASHWEFTQNSQQYVSVAVAANAFRSVGAYNTTTNDMSIGTRGDMPLSFTRSYSSTANDQQKGIGKGWSYLPSQLSTPQVWDVTTDAPSGGYSGLYPTKLTYQDQQGAYETFTYSTSSHTYQPDRADYHTRIVRNSDGSFSALAKDQSYFKFGIGLVLLLHKDKNGNGIYYQYDGTTAITRIQDDENNTLTITYNAQNRVASVKDWLNRTVTYGYDGGGNLTSVTDPRGKVVTYGYDTSSRLTTVTDRENRQLISNTYNSQDKVSSSTNGSGLSVTYAYDETNRTVTATDMNNNVSKTFYDANSRVLKQEDPYGNATIYTYGTEALPLTVKDKRNNTTTYTYSSAGNPTSVTYPDNKQITYQYDTSNRLAQISDGRYTPSKTTTYSYDTNGNLQSKNNGGITISSTYDSYGQIISSTNERGYATAITRGPLGKMVTSTDPLGATTTYTYDVIGRVTQKSDPLNKQTNYTYDSNSNVLTVATAAGTETNTYDGENQIIQSKDGNNHSSYFNYNSAGKQTNTYDPLIHLTSYGYDAYDNMQSKQDTLSHTTQYAYDKLHRQTQSTTPLGKVKKWFYDANGNIIKTTDESNRDTIHTYNAMDKLTQTTFPDASTISYTYDARGNMTQATSTAGTSTYVYDAQDRLTSETDANGEALSYAYDSANNMTQITYPGSKNVSYAYDAANRLKSVSDWNSQRTQYTYNVNGTLQNKLLPNGVLTEYAYDNANRLTSVQHAQDQKQISKFSYARNGANNVTSETEHTPAAPTTYTIFDDALASGWSNSWSWSSTTNLADTTTPAEGSKDIAWQTTGAWAGLHLRSTTGTINTAPYTALSFVMKSTQANQAVAVNLKDANDNNMSSIVDLGRYGYPINSEYTQYAIPLAAFNATNTQISGLTFEDYSGNAQPNLYIDSIRLTTANATPISLYNDELAANFIRWSWNDTVNMADTNPFQGSNNIAVTGTSGYSGIQFHNNNGFSTKGYQTLRFALKGSQTGQEYTVQMTNSSGAGLASELNIKSYANRVDSAGYTLYSIPLADVAAGNTTSYGFILQNQNSASQPTVRLDNVQLIAAPTLASNSEQTSYTYDALDRVTAATSPNQTYAYTYDAAGNRTSTTNGSTTLNATFNSDNQLTTYGSRSFTYDNQGNELTDGMGATYAFGILNQLLSSTSGSSTVNYVYDAKGNRIAKKNGSTPAFQYVNTTAGPLANVLQIKDQVNNTQNYLIYGPELMSQGSTASTGRSYYLNDGLGNIRYVTSNTGSTLTKFNYDPFGTQTSGAGLYSDFRYQGEQRDPSGLTYLRARYYDSLTGRFISRDPISGSLTSPQTQNGYAYSGNNPVNWSDPSGMAYVNTSLSYSGYMVILGVPIPITVQGSYIVSDKGKYIAIGVGESKKGGGWSITSGPGEPQPGFAFNGSGSYKYLGVSGSMSSSGVGYEGGVGSPGYFVGGSLTSGNIGCSGIINGIVWGGDGNTRY